MLINFKQYIQEQMIGEAQRWEVTVFKASCLLPIDQNDLLKFVYQYKPGLKCFLIPISSNISTTIQLIVIVLSYRSNQQISCK